MNRLLSSSTEEEDLYLNHATIGVVVVTLALLLLVEVIRHSLDVAARGHVFFQTVLEVIYREITTLGFVELLLHLLHTLDVNLQLEEAFTKVHFMLFYTAIINAIQSCIVRLLAVRRTYKTWVVTEDIEIGHYVSIRKEFDRLERKIKQESPRYFGCISERALPTLSSIDVNDSQSSYCLESFREALSDLALKIRHRHLYRRRNKLLTVIRFHELRAHFIECNNLPPNFKVSSYLERSLRSALLDFVHISPAAWIMFIAICNLIFFMAGMILNNTHSYPRVEEFLMYFLVMTMVVLVAFLTALYFKMRYIFYKMQKLKLSGQNITTTRPTLLSSLRGGTTESFDQLDLFWGSNPRVVIVITQIMQFLYSIGLAGVLTFFYAWPDSAVVTSYEFVLLLLFSYSIFIKFTSVILPWYTLCTSMGQLVNKEILHETVAKLRLSEEIRKMVSLEEETRAENEIARRRSEIEDINARTASWTRGDHSSRVKGPHGKSPSDSIELKRSMDFNHVDDFPQDPILRGITETDIFSGNLESQLNDHSNLSSGMQEKERVRCQSAGVELIALSKPIQSFKSKSILPSESTQDVVPLDVDVENYIHDVPDAMVTDETTATRQGRMKALAKGIDLVAFFQSIQYRLISSLFGPTICFWIIAMRINMFNITEGLFYDHPFAWYELLDEFFWCEVSWYCLMIFEMVLITAVCSNKRDREGLLFSCSAAVFGVMIIFMCLLLLIYAETERCCQNDSFVAKEIHEAERGHRVLRPKSSKSDHHDDSSIGCCPEFGTRRYGGLGEIEPFTSLIVLFPMRFLFASCIVGLFRNVAKKDQHKAKHESSHHAHHEIDSDKLRDIWLTAIGVHSEVAEMCGLFSGEMLQCMLGIYLKKPIDNFKELENSVRDDQTSDSSKMVEHQRSQNQVSDEGAVDHSSQQLFNWIQSSYISSTDLTSQLKSSANCTDNTAPFDEFSYPTARLICKMRRCERLLLPLLDKGIVVDAALTNHELILFNVLDDTEDISLAPDHAVSSLNGGKGLYLCDVARGRRIVNKFNLDEISGVDNKLRVAIVQMDISSDDVEVNHIDKLAEYWEGGDISSDGYQVSSMNKCWGHVNEDILKIRFKHHTLYLRFLVDLKEMDDCSNSTAHVGAMAKLWCCNFIIG